MLIGLITESFSHGIFATLLLPCKVFLIGLLLLRTVQALLYVCSAYHILFSIALVPLRTVSKLVRGSRAMFTSWFLITGP